MNHDTLGEVWLVGAGCGAADLITVRGLRLIQRCDAIVYDDLIDEALLREAPVHAERVYMGKRSGHHSAPQAEICAELIRQARLGRMVVRLKGGDPYVFGRGGEEMLVLKDEGIPCEEIPGITSAIAAPAAAGIPVTHRQCSRMVTILTASAINSEGKKEALTQVDYKALAQLQGTLVVLMGMHHLEELALKLMEAGKSPETPAAVIMEGATIRQRSVRATLGTIAKTAAE
ncbi:MAG: uroporphyrinogen-III C-methyltransferase, partial [Candidatus Ventricola sp.]|nr:uroporphyrinogen-III C-methyltransferase [Candidatus Ventricola sp.]